MPRFFVSIGSNINPKKNIVWVLSKLLQLSPQLHLSRIIETEPVGVPNGGGMFLNLTVCLDVALQTRALKQQFNQFETEAGRDRSDPDSHQKSRPLDLDILFSLPKSQHWLDPDMLPVEPYVRPMLLELLDFLGITCRAEAPVLPPGVTLRLREVLVGRQAVTIWQHPASHTVEIVR